MFISRLTDFRGLAWVILLAVSLLGVAAFARGGGGPTRQPPPGVHSTIITSDGYVRDDELAMHIASQISAHGGQVRDVIFLANTCYGGGFLTEITYIFDVSGPCPGVPWVFGSAAEWYEYAWAFRAEWCQDPVANLGSKFTSALAGPQSGHSDPTPGAMLDTSTDNVLADLTTARQHDEAGPFHESCEATVIAVGNGGGNTTWSPAGASHEIILFGGRMDRPAYFNDMENMQNALQGLYGSAPHNFQIIQDGTRQNLLDGVSAACANIDANTELLLHFTDHGGYTIDIVEHLQSQGEQPPYSVPQFKDIVIWRPWPIRPKPTPEDPNEPEPGPEIDLTLLDPIESEHWVICVNDLPIPLPPGTLFGELELPVAWESLNSEENHLTIQAIGDPGGPFVFDAMELWSGPVAMATDPPPDSAVCATMGYAFTAPWFPGSAIPFDVPPQVDWPAWEQNGPLAYSYADPRWPGAQGFWGVSGPEQAASLAARVFSTHSPAEKQQVVVAADIMSNDPVGNAWTVTVQPPDAEGLRPPAAAGPQSTEMAENADGSVRYTWVQELTPVVGFEDIAITLRTGAGGDSYIFIDNLTIDVAGQPKDKPLDGLNVPPEQQDKSLAQYYYFSSPEWPPAPHYEVLPTWPVGTMWDRFGSCPLDWLADVTDHHGVLGVPDGLVGEAQLVVHIEDQAEPAGRERVSCQFDYFAGGGLLWWQPIVPPECLIENNQEEIEALAEGWQRVRLTFDVVPPPAWQEFRWFMSASGRGGALAIDNFAISSSTWWADFWHDAFDFHEAGLGLHGRYWWKGWDGNPLADGLVTEAQSRSLFNALQVAGQTDLVHEFDLPAERYVFSAWVYVPGDFQSGGGPPFAGSYFVLMNTYSDGGLHEESDWSAQMNFDSNDGMLKVYYGNGLNTVGVPYVPDEWVELRVVVDLDADWTEVYYDGQFVVGYVWTGGVIGGGGGALSIAAVDLYANGSTEVYYDDLHLRPMVAGDLNWDDIVDFDDFLAFAECLSGPEIQPASECRYADLDREGDADMADFAAFQRVFVGQ